MAGQTSKENGKKGGRPKGLNAINAEKGKAALIEAYLKNIKPINEKLLELAMNGDMAAIKELHDRVYGKAPQSLALSNPDGSAIFKDENRAKAKGALGYIGTPDGE